MTRLGKPRSLALPCSDRLGMRCLKPLHIMKMDGRLFYSFSWPFHISVFPDLLLCLNTGCVCGVNSDNCLLRIQLMLRETREVPDLLAEGLMSG